MPDLIHAFASVLVAVAILIAIGVCIELLANGWFDRDSQ